MTRVQQLGVFYTAVSFCIGTQEALRIQNISVGVPDDLWSVS